MRASVPRGLGPACRAAAVLAAALFVTGCTAHRRPAEPAPASPEAESLPLASFEQAWRRISETYPYEDFRGLDWAGARDELLPRARDARDAAELRPVLRDLLSRLGESHFEVIPGDALPEPGATRERRKGSAASLEAPAAPGGEVGLGLDVIDDALVVVRVEPGSAAERAGVRPGWTLESVDGHDVSGLAKTARDAVDDPVVARLQALRTAQAWLGAGAPGSVAHLAFAHGGGGRATFEIPRTARTGVPVTLGHLPTLETTFHHEVLPGTRVGYIRFNIWMTPVAEPFTRAMTEFVDQGVQGVIVDLRGNPGGVGGMVMGLAGHFIRQPGVTLGDMKTRGADLHFVANPRAVVFDGPLAILVDGLSASTSELFAGGLQDVGRARIFGTPTPGMALPSVVEELPDGDRLQFAIADLVLPSGHRLEGHGVQPDEVVERTRASLLAGEDDVVRAAVAWIESRPPEHS